jgi:16S rRNA (adenine1518-N6/adenine1519-N6)-dimethyltransferase
MVLLIDLEKPHPVRAENEEHFRGVVRAAFSRRRKTILNSLDGGVPSLSRENVGEALRASGIDPYARAETLTVDEYLRLSSAVEERTTIP